MFKRNYKKTLVAILSIVMVISTVITVMANTNDTNDDYGTLEGGIKANADKLMEYTPLEVFPNGDFKEGLKYWGGRNIDDPNTVVTFVEDDYGSYINFKCTRSVNDPNVGITSVPFKISGVQAGDYIGIRFKYRNRIDYTTSNNHYLKQSIPRIYITQNGYAANSRAGCWEHGYNTLPKASSWTTKITNSAGNNGLVAVTEPTDGQEIFFMLNFYTGAYENSGSGENAITEVDYDFDIDDIEIIKFKGSTATEGYTVLTTVDSDAYGKFETGIYGNGDFNLLKSMTAIDKFTNGDFEQGLKYWAGRGKDNLTDIATTKTEGNNTYINFKYTIGSSNENVGIVSVPFTVKDVQAGDYITLRVNYRNRNTYTNVTAPRIALIQGECDDSGSGWLAAGYENSGHALPVKADWTTKTLGNPGYSNGIVAVKSDREKRFTIAIITGGGNNAGASYDFDIDNIQILKCDDNKATNYEVLNIEPLGTTDAGIKLGGEDLKKIEPQIKLTNGDFEDGLKYWGVMGSGNDVTSYATVITENSNNYLHFETTVGENKATKGLLSVPFKISGVEVGDYVGVRFKYRNSVDYSSTQSATPRIALRQNGYADKNRAANYKYGYCELPKKSEWATYITKWAYNNSQKSLNPVTEVDEGEEIYFMLLIDTGDKDNADAQYSFDIDDIEIIKFDNATEADNKYYETLDGQVLNVLDSKPYYGTEEAGLVRGESYVKTITATDKAENISLSQGLKYWLGAGAITKPADVATVTDGVLTLNATTVGNGIISAPFKASEINVNSIGIAFKHTTDNNSMVNVEILKVDGDATAVITNAVVDSINGYVIATPKADITINSTDVIAVRITANSENCISKISDIKFISKDAVGISGKSVYTNLDGTPAAGYQIGDANADGRIDICDLVRINKYINNDTTEIYFAAAKLDKDTSLLNIKDIAALRNGLLSKIAN